MHPIETQRFLVDVAAMQIDEAVAIVNDGDYDGIYDVVQEFRAYANNIMSKKELSQNYFFTLALINILSLPTSQRAIMLHSFIRSHGYFVPEIVGFMR